VKLFSIATTLLFLCGAVLADEAADDLARNKVLIEKLKQNPYGRRREVKVLPRGKEQTPLLISLPDQPLQPYPALYVVLDGTPSGVAGTEYDHDYPYTNAIIVGLPSSSRIRDYTIKPGEIPEPKGEEFMRHLATEVMPFIEKNYGPFSVKILVGASFGGIATLDAFLSYPNSFDVHGALDASIWYNADYYKNKLLALSKTPQAFENKCLLMTGSEDEPTLAASARKFDRLIAGLELPSTFHHVYKRLTELEHIQSIRASNMYVTPFVFAISDIIADEELKGLSIAAFEAKLEKAWRTKTCFKHPTMNELSALYYKFIESLVAEKRFDDAIAVYDKTKVGSPVRTLSMLGKDASLWKSFSQLSPKQKDKLAKDYHEDYPKMVALLPQFAIHLRNPELAAYSTSNIP